jgi:hypothetical protein
MKSASQTIDIYIETGSQRTFAVATEWPGWCRSGRNEDAALQALFAYGPRYEEVLHPARIPFDAPTQLASLKVRARFPGTTTTDFGSPDISPAFDQEPLREEDLRRFQELLQACWKKLDKAVKAADGKTLRKGPRGGGRELTEIVAHVAEAEVAYLGRIGQNMNQGGVKDDPQRRKIILKALAASAQGEIPAQGPRGGRRWFPRYFVRRVAWHILDHAWEIEDRIKPPHADKDI